MCVVGVGVCVGACWLCVITIIHLPHSPHSHTNPGKGSPQQNAKRGSYEGTAPQAGGPWVGPGPDAAAIGGGKGVRGHTPLPPLQFESNFESGNLRAAVQVRGRESACVSVHRVLIHTVLGALLILILVWTQPNISLPHNSTLNTHTDLRKRI